MNPEQAAEKTALVGTPAFKPTYFGRCAHEATLRAPDASDLSAAVRRDVVGQDQAVDHVCAYVSLALRRVSRIRAGVPAHELPRQTALLLVAPTASGKTHMLRAVARASGVHLEVIDSSNITGTGWRGVDVSKALEPVAKWQAEHRGTPCLVVFDECDKAIKHTAAERGDASFDPQRNFLALMDGVPPTFDDPRLSLDTGGVIYAFCGAFTGIEAIVARRLGACAAGFGAARVGADEARALITTDDIVAYGMEPELLGRMSDVVVMPALSEESLVAIVEDRLVPQYQRMLPDHALAVTDEAAHLMARRALDSGLGARVLASALSQELQGVLPGLCIGDAITVGAEAGAITTTLAGGRTRPEPPATLGEPEADARRSGRGLEHDLNRIGIALERAACDAHASWDDMSNRDAVRNMANLLAWGQFEDPTAPEDVLAARCLADAIHVVTHLTKDGMKSWFNVLAWAFADAGEWEDLVPREASEELRPLLREALAARHTPAARDALVERLEWACANEPALARRFAVCAGFNRY